jgi:hypothetical protein
MYKPHINKGITCICFNLPSYVYCVIIVNPHLLEGRAWITFNIPIHEVDATFHPLLISFGHFMNANDKNLLSWLKSGFETIGVAWICQ